jgi:hypothetical protein
MLVPTCRIKLFKLITINFKNIIFSLFYLRSCFGPQVCIGNYSSRICGVVPWRGSIRKVILLHTSYCLNTSLTNYLFAPLAFHIRHFSCFAVTNRDWPTIVVYCSSLPTCIIVSNISFTRGNRESLHISLLHQGKRYFSGSLKNSYYSTA